MTPVVLIGCSATKLDRAAPARDLYTGRVFTASVAYAESRGLPWFVLSALHGVIPPDQVIEPYDVTVAGLTRGERLSWAGRIAEQLDEIRAPGRVEVLAGAEYVKACERYGRHRTFEAPLAGLGVGERYARLVDLTAEVERSRGIDRALNEARAWMREAGDAGEVLLSGVHLRAVRDAIGGAP